MKVSRLQKFVLVLWGIILVIFLVFGVTVFSRQEARSKNLQVPNSLDVTLETLPPVITQAPSPAVIYLPSATARASTPIPVTTTPIFRLVMPVRQYSLTIAPDVDPLTGLKLSNPGLMNRRPVAVKISSFPRDLVRPVQTGLTHADVVYEYYIGDDHLTRFIAVFYSQDAARAGPVRSGRFFDEYIMRMYHSSLVYAHADMRVEKHLLESDLRPLLFEEKDNFFPPLIDSGSRIAETRLFVNTAGVGARLADNSHQDLRTSIFGSLMYPMAFSAINRIFTHYSIFSYNYWEYDPASQVYKRFSDVSNAPSFGEGEAYAPHIDNLNGAQVSADNVIVLVVPHIFHNEFDRADSLIDITLNGIGDAYLFREGRMLKVKWVRDQVDQPIQLMDDNLMPVPMKPGVTFYQVIDPESTIKQIGDKMDFSFFIPLLKVTLTPTPWGFVPSPTPTKVRN